MGENRSYMNDLRVNSAPEVRINIVFLLCMFTRQAMPLRGGENSTEKEGDRN